MQMYILCVGLCRSTVSALLCLVVLLRCHIQMFITCALLEQINDDDDDDDDDVLLKVAQKSFNQYPIEYFRIPDRYGKTP